MIAAATAHKVLMTGKIKPGVFFENLLSFITNEKCYDVELRLNKHGHTRENVLVGLAYVARHITHTPARDIAIDAYSKRVR